MDLIGIFVFGDLQGKFYTVVQTFLIKDPADMALDGSQAKIQFCSDLFVAQPSCNCFGYAPLRHS